MQVARAAPRELNSGAWGGVAATSLCPSGVPVLGFQTPAPPVLPGTPQPACPTTSWVGFLDPEDGPRASVLGLP